MRWLLLVAAAALAIGAASEAGSQEAVTAGVTLEPGRVTVGDLLTLEISVQHEAGLVLEGPGGPEAFQPLDLIRADPPEVRDLDGRRQQTTFRYELAAFVTGEVELRPLTVTLLDEKTPLVATQPASIVVESVVPPEGPFQLRELKAPLQASAGPPTWVWGALIMAAFTAVSIFTMALARVPTLRRPRPLSPPPAAPETPPERVALRELDQIAGDGLLDRGALPEYYHRMGECLRAYLARRYGIPAAAMTPAELEARLRAVLEDGLAARQSASTLEQCQAVQFAGYRPSRERAEADLTSAYEIVRLTTPAEDSPADLDGSGR